MRVAQINVVATLSTGRIAVEIIHALTNRGHKGLMAFSRGYAPADVPWIRIGNAADVNLHGICARLTDRAGFFSRLATRRLIKQLRAYRPDVVHLHNLHGYYLHLPTLFAYLREENLPVVWTLHDCWAYTGHCAYYSMVQGENEEGRHRRAQAPLGCQRWKKGCGRCPQKHAYPRSLLLDQSRRNWADKKAMSLGLSRMVLVTPSQWLANEVRQSFLHPFPLRVIPNGIDLSTFFPCQDSEYLASVVRKYKLEELAGRHMLLSVASTWDERKGLEDFIELSKALSPEEFIVLVGLSDWQMEKLPKNILGIGRTDSLRELCALYTAADLYISLSHEETMGMTLIEAMACGTQVLCYDTTALPENVPPQTGSVVPLGNIDLVATEARRLCLTPKSAAACRAHAETYDHDRRFGEYVTLYEKILEE